MADHHHSYYLGAKQTRRLPARSHNLERTPCPKYRELAALR
jgi:hypothetical protein